MKTNSKIKRFRNANFINRSHFHNINSMSFLLNEDGNRSAGILDTALNFFLTFTLIVVILGILVNTVKAEPPADIAKGAVWRYFKVTDEAPFKWESLGFDDSKWFVGPSGFGYGKGPNNGTVVVSADGTITYTPNPGFIGADIFAHTVNNIDGKTSNKAMVTVFVSPLAPSFLDDFSMDTTEDYTVIDTWTTGGFGSFLYDSAMQRAKVLTGDNIGLTFSHELPPLANGTFHINFLPTVKFPSGGKFSLKLTQDENNYYVLENADNGKGPWYVKKIISGIEVDNAAFSSEYTQKNNYSITISFSPNLTTANAFGEMLTMNKDGNRIIVKSFMLNTRQQDAFYDNIAYTDKTVVQQSPTAVDDFADTIVDIPVNVNVVDNDRDVVTLEAVNNYLSTGAEGTGVTDFQYSTDTAVFLPLKERAINQNITVETRATTNSSIATKNNGPYNAGTDAHGEFDGLVTMIGGLELREAITFADIELRGLDPSLTYRISLSTNRNNLLYNGDRFTRVKLVDAAGHTNLSTPGVEEITSDEVSFNTGYNTVNGYVARWQFKPGADGTVKIESRWDNSRPGIKGYAMTHMKLEQVHSTIDPVTVTIVDGPTSGTAVTNLDGIVTYTPNLGFTGSDTFTYTVKDNFGATSNVASVTMAVNTSNSSPVANDDFSATIQDMPVDINVVANDNAFDSTIDPATVTITGNFETELDDMQGNFLTVIARNEFIVNDPFEINGMKLSVLCDGPFIAFINGIEVIKSDILVTEQLDISGFIDEILPGANLLAIKCLNDDINSDNFSFIPTLKFEGVQ